MPTSPVIWRWAAPPVVARLNAAPPAARAAGALPRLAAAGRFRLLRPVGTWRPLSRPGRSDPAVEELVLAFLDDEVLRFGAADTGASLDCVLRSATRCELPLASGARIVTWATHVGWWGTWGDGVIGPCPDRGEAVRRLWRARGTEAGPPDHASSFGDAWSGG